MRWQGLVGIGMEIMALGCGSSEPAPVDPLATDYCAICSVFPGCERVVTDTLNAACPDETRSYYQCVTDNECDVTACESEWSVREVCMNPPSRVAAERNSVIESS